MVAPCMSFGAWSFWLVRTPRRSRRARLILGGLMPIDVMLDDLDLTAFMSSKICHDLVGPVGAINNGLELLEEETDDETREYAFQLIQNSAQIAWARLEFARLAFGASAGLGTVIDLGHAERIARAFVEEGRHQLKWTRPTGRRGQASDPPAADADLHLHARGPRRGRNPRHGFTSNLTAPTFQLRMQGSRRAGSRADRRHLRRAAGGGPRSARDPALLRVAARLPQRNDGDGRQKRRRSACSWQRQRVEFVRARRSFLILENRTDFNRRLINLRNCCGILRMTATEGVGNGAG